MLHNFANTDGQLGHGCRGGHVALPLARSLYFVSIRSFFWAVGVHPTPSSCGCGRGVRGMWSRLWMGEADCRGEGKRFRENGVGVCGMWAVGEVGRPLLRTQERGADCEHRGRMCDGI